MDINEFENMSGWAKQEALSSLTISYWVKRGSAALLGVILLSMGGCPMYNVWSQGLKGEAELARAEQNRKILINEAKAKSESAKYWAEAEVKRARGAAKANEIVAGSLGGPEGYLRWLFIEKLDEIRNGQVIYLPTEAGVPLLEAGRAVQQKNGVTGEQGDG